MDGRGRVSRGERVANARRRFQPCDLWGISPVSVRYRNCEARQCGTCIVPGSVPGCLLDELDEERRIEMSEQHITGSVDWKVNNADGTPWIDPRLADRARALEWHTRFLQFAQMVASWSKDPSTKVGACIVDSHRRILGTGYNGFPRGVEDTLARYADRPVKYAMVVHAEANAILNALGSVEGATLYCNIGMPCSDCAKLIIQAGIKRVVCPAG